MTVKKNRLFGNILSKSTRHSDDLESDEKYKNVSKTEIENTRPADFESAISATGYGKFNLILMLITIPAAWTSQFESTVMSFVFPAAQCDLHLSLDDKGILNAITYSGMVLSGFAWGYIVDRFGRKKILVIGYLLDGIIVLLSTFSQNFAMLVVFKFLGGFVVNGPYAALTAYLSEFHSNKYRARVQMALGAIFGFGNLFLPVLASAILPSNLNFSFFDDYIKIYSWNIYLLVSSLAGIIAGTSFIFMPESPKFLMSKGLNEEALEIFKKVYSLNSGKSPDAFPISKLVNEMKTLGEDTETKIRKNGNLSQVKQLFKWHYLKIILLVCIMQTCFLMCVNTLRLWMPQIFQAIHEYQESNNDTTNNLCVMLEFFKPTEDLESHLCSVNMENNFAVYFNSMVIALVGIIAYFIAGSLINIFGKKKLLGVMGTASGGFVMSMYFSQNTATTLALTSLNLALANICIDVIITVIVVIFPTSLRAIAISIVMMCGRGGSMFGNLLFPILLQTGCAAPFFLLGSLLIGCTCLSSLLPNTDMKDLK